MIEEVINGFVVTGLGLFMVVLSWWLVMDNDQPNPGE
jgi:hypothetical protein